MNDTKNKKIKRSKLTEHEAINMIRFFFEKIERILESSGDAFNFFEKDKNKTIVIFQIEKTKFGDLDGVFEAIHVLGRRKLPAKVKK